MKSRISLVLSICLFLFLFSSCGVVKDAKEGKYKISIPFFSRSF